MSKDIAIRTEGLGKRYRLGQTIDLKRTFRETLSTLPLHLARKVKGAARRLAGRLTESRSEEGIEVSDPETPPGMFWALRDINLEIQRGDVVGIIGSNGAGKSTLLKIFSRITPPTQGFVELRGRISSLLEVGTGFHAELTGRENIYLNAAILGMHKAEIDSKFDDIVEFAEVSQFIDTPVKRYSSGMYVRLAFAVAAHLEPEIMVVDEVLSVGDAAFQRKCLGKMKDVAGHGRTVIFVSHNMSAVRNLCQTCILLDHGRLVRLGPVADVIQQYLEGTEKRNNEVTWPDTGTAPGNAKAKILAVRVLKADGESCRMVDLATPFIIEVEYINLAPGTILNVSLSLFNHEDVYVMASPSCTDKHWYMKPHPEGRYRSRCVIPGKLLNKGVYSVSILLVEKGRYIIAHINRVVSVELIDLDVHGEYDGRWNGVVRPPIEWNTEKEEKDDQDERGL